MDIYKMVGYQTTWHKIKKDGGIRRGNYVTKVKTPFHDELHEVCDFARSGPIMSGPIPLHEVERTTKTPRYMEWLKHKAH